MQPPQIPQLQSPDGLLNQFQAKLAGLLNPFFKQLGAFLGTLGTVTLTAQPAAGGSAGVSGKLLDGNGNAITSQPFVSVRTLASTAAQGAITTVSGDEALNTGAPAGQQSQAVIRAKSDGTFAFSVADGSSGDVVYCEAIVSGFLPGAVLLVGF